MKPLAVRLESEALAHPVHVYEYRLTEGISRLYELDLVLICRDGQLDPTALVSEEATFIFSTGDDERRVHGLIAECLDLLNTEADHHQYRVKLVPRFWRSTLVQLMDIYLDLSIPELIRHKLELTFLKEGEDFELRLTGQYPKREFVVQYQETDLDFISRLCEHLGICYHFEQRDGRDVLVFSDGNHGFRPITEEGTAQFCARGEGLGVFELALRSRMLPQHFIQRDYNYRTPNTDLMGAAKLNDGHAGAVFEYGGHFANQQEAQQLAQVRAQQVGATRNVFEGKSAVFAFRAGATVVLNDHPMGDLELMITEVVHQGRQGWRAGDETPDSFANELKAIKKETVFRPSRVTPKPVVHGFLAGVIEAADDSEYALVDDQGRYLVRFLFDTAPQGERQASRPIRMMQPHAGPGYGMHFPLRAGVEVLIAFVGGDPDRPVIAGTAPNPQTQSPVVSSNRERNVIRTGGGNEINIDDSKGSERIKLSTPHQDTLFQLGSPNFPSSGATLATRGARADIATQGFAGAANLSSGFSTLVNHITSSTVVTDASPPSGLEFLLGANEALRGGLGLALQGIDMVRNGYLADEKQKAQTANEAAAAATRAQQCCRSCRKAAFDELPTTDQPVEEKIAELAAVENPTQDQQDQLARLEAVKAFNDACDADDDAYLTAIGTLEDRNGIVLANREGTNPNFDPVMDRDAWEATRLYDYDKYVALHELHDGKRWDGTAVTPADNLTDADKEAYGHDKAAWLASERKRWDPCHAELASDEAAWSALTDADKEAWVSPMPADWQDMDATEKQSHLETAKKSYLDDAATRWDRPPSKLVRKKCYKELIDLLPDGDCKTALEACYATGGGCADLDEKRTSAIDTQERFMWSMRDHGVALRTMREIELWSAAVGDNALAGLGVLWSTLINIGTLCKGQGARTGLDERWAAASELLQSSPLRKIDDTGLLTFQKTQAHLEFIKAYGDFPVVGLQGRHTKGKAHFGPALASLFAGLPFVNPKCYLHHLASDNDLSLWGNDTLTAGSEFSLLLGLGNKEVPNGVNPITKKPRTKTEIDEAKGNVFIMGGESVRILSNAEVEVAARSKLLQCSQGIALTGRGEDGDSSGAVLLRSTDGGGDSADDGDLGSQLGLSGRTVHVKTCPRDEPDELLADLVLDECEASIKVDNSGKADKGKARVTLIACKDGALKSGLVLDEDTNATLLAGDDWGLTISGDGESLSAGTEEWGLSITKDTVEIGKLGLAQLEIDSDCTEVWHDKNVNIMAGTDVTFDVPKVSFGGADIEFANLTIKGEALGGLGKQLQDGLDAAKREAREALEEATAELRRELDKKMNWPSGSPSGYIS